MLNQTTGIIAGQAKPHTRQRIHSNHSHGNTQKTIVVGLASVNKDLNDNKKNIVQEPGLDKNYSIPGRVVVLIVVVWSLIKAELNSYT